MARLPLIELRSEGFVRHRYISKKESEDIMENFFSEAHSH